MGLLSLDNLFKRRWRSSLCAFNCSNNNFFFLGKFVSHVLASPALTYTSILLLAYLSVLGERGGGGKGERIYAYILPDHAHADPKRYSVVTQ
jgi:hypothetical protein